MLVCLSMAIYLFEDVDVSLCAGANLQNCVV